MTVYGPKYERDLTIVEIAKRLRAEIKAAVKEGKLPKCKYSVRISRYSGGRSLNVAIKDYPKPIHNRRHLELDHELSKGSKLLGLKKYQDLWAERETMPQYTEELVDLIRTLEMGASQWNYDGSDPQTDYFNVNYYSHVDIDCEQAHAEWERVTKEIKAADHDLRIFDPEVA